MISAVAAATLTVTASGAQTRSPFSPAAQLAPAAGDAGDDGQREGISYGFEQPGDLRGWDVTAAGPPVDDTTAVHEGERSLGIVVDAGAGGRRIDVTASPAGAVAAPDVRRRHRRCAADHTQHRRLRGGTVVMHRAGVTVAGRSDRDTAGI